LHFLQCAMIHHENNIVSIFLFFIFSFFCSMIHHEKNIGTVSLFFPLLFLFALLSFFRSFSFCWQLKCAMICCQNITYAHTQTHTHTFVCVYIHGTSFKRARALSLSLSVNLFPFFLAFFVLMVPNPTHPFPLPPRHTIPSLSRCVCLSLHVCVQVIPTYPKP
jgi:hypothetical protein